MKAIIITKDHATLILSKEELTVLRNALNVVCIEIEEWEFQTRLGIYLKDALITLKALTLILEKMKEKN